MKNSVIKTAKFLIGWPLSILALIFLWKLFTPQLPAIEKNIIHANFFLLSLALGLFQLYFLFRVLLWQSLLKSKEHNVSMRNTSWYWSVAEINRYIPGNIWSIVGRGAAFGKFGVKQSTLLFLWAQESLLVFLGSLTVGIIGLALIFNHVLPDFPLKYSIYWLVIVGILFIDAAWIFQEKMKKTHMRVLKPGAAFRLLLLSIAAFFLFGLGTYTTIAALFSLPPQDIPAFIGLFSFSYVVGYLSFVTPMGLGVREFAIASGLAKFVSSAVAGIASLFARFFLIISELVFLCIAFAVFKFHKKIHAITTLMDHIRKYKYEYLLGMSIAVYVAYFTTASFLRYTNFFTGRFDLGNMDQTVWNTLHGKIFMLTDPNGTNSMSRLGIHADFILILLAPFYLLWEDPRMLLLIQTAVLGLGALFIYLLAKNVFKSKTLALVFSFAYLLNPSVQNANLYDFHAVTLATTFFLGAWYFLTKKRYLWVTLFLLLAALTKEEAWIVVGLFGIYISLQQCSNVAIKQWLTIVKPKQSFNRILFGVVLAAFSFLFFYLLVWKFIPLAKGGQHFALSYYGDFGSTPTGIVKNILLSPKKVFNIFLGSVSLTYFFELLFPLGFVSLFAPQFLIFALPDLGINLLSTNTQLQQIYYQYTAVITPFLFIAALYGTKMLLSRFQKIPIFIFSCFFLFCTVVSAYYYGPLPLARHPNIDVFTKQETDKQIIAGFLQDIPTSFSVAATNNIGSHLSHRQKIFTIPEGIDKADIVVFLLNDQFAQPSLSAQKQIAENMKHDKNYIEVFKKNAFVVFEKRDLYTKKEPTLQKGKLYPAAIQTLENRDFEGGQITIQKTLQTTTDITTVLFSYPSDGLTLFGRADIPNTASPQQLFPIVIINRGFLSTSGFNETTSYENISQAFATHGFLAITPNYRNNGESDTDMSIVGALGYPIDVLNLINSLPTFAQTDTKHVFLWGYSLGGQVTLSTLAAVDQNKDITPTVRAASVWAPVIDQYRAYIQFHQLFPSQTVPYTRVDAAFGPITKNPIPWESVSPLFYADDITTPIRIVHGLSDTITPYQWSIELYNDMKSFHNNAQIALYTNTDHNFTNSWKQIVLGDIQYFQTFLK